MTRLRVTWRAAAVVWAAHAARARSRLVTSWPRLSPLLLVLAGLGMALGGGALIGTWCLGLVMIAEAVLLVVLGLLRDDGSGRRPVHEPHTVQDILERQRRLP